MTRTYAVVVRRARANYSADCPDLPGCIATGRTLDETLRRMRAAMRMHIHGLREAGLAVPRPAKRLSTLVRERGEEHVYTRVHVAA